MSSFLAGIFGNDTFSRRPAPVPDYFGIRHSQLAVKHHREMQALRTELSRAGYSAARKLAQAKKSFGSENFTEREKAFAGVIDDLLEHRSKSAVAGQEGLKEMFQAIKGAFSKKISKEVQEHHKRSDYGVNEPADAYKQIRELLNKKGEGRAEVTFNLLHFYDIGVPLESFADILAQRQKEIDATEKALATAHLLKRALTLFEEFMKKPAKTIEEAESNYDKYEKEMKAIADQFRSAKPFPIVDGYFTPPNSILIPSVTTTKASDLGDGTASSSGKWGSKHQRFANTPITETIDVKVIRDFFTKNSAFYDKYFGVVEQDTVGHQIGDSPAAIRGAASKFGCNTFDFGSNAHGQLLIKKTILKALLLLIHVHHM
jgi:hypothetical protein